MKIKRQIYQRRLPLNRCPDRFIRNFSSIELTNMVILYQFKLFIYFVWLFFFRLNGYAVDFVRTKIKNI